jgi:hypothetical protein
MPKVVNQTDFLAAIVAEYGEVKTITRKEIIDLVEKSADLNWPAWFVNDARRRVGRGEYSTAEMTDDSPAVSSTRSARAKSKKLAPVSIPSVPQSEESVEITQEEKFSLLAASQGSESLVSLVPEKAPGFVPFGNYNDLMTIIKSGIFYTAFITGMSGNGKTKMPEQICASLNRECILVSVTKETDEDSLLGGFRLIDGKTVWQNGPVIVAMERGAVLVLDEIDLGDNKLMCLQPILEGKSIYLKKINKVVKPAAGFTIVATANTKGKGSDDGRFIGTNVMNEAMLDRFSITMEQEYPPMKVEARILNNVMRMVGVEDTNFVTKLTIWGDTIRKTFAKGGCTELVSTRRLIDVCKAYAIFDQNKMKAVELCLNRFDEETKASFSDLYMQIDGEVEKTAAVDPDVRTLLD